VSAKIAIRTVGGQVLEVPPIRLNWVAERPRLIQLIDLVRKLYFGGAPAQPTADECALLSEFLAEVAKAAGYNGPPLDVDVADLGLVLAALRGAAPDPTPRSPAGSDT
jgi:hypothetical protein